MAITSYPRVTIQGSGAAQNPQNGVGLMVLNPSTQLYEAATAATFGGGGGSGGATEINQETQIIEAQNANIYLQSINTASYAFGQPFANYLNDIAVNTSDMKNTLNNIYNLLNNGQAKVVLVSTTGDSVGVTGGRLNVDTGA